MIRRVALLSAVVLALASAAIASPLRSFETKLLLHPQRAYAAGITHMVGGFNLDNPQDAQSAAADGVYTSFHYDYAPPSSSVEQSYQSLGIHEFNGAISQYMWYYECHRVHSVVTVPAGVWGFCSTDADPTMTYSKLMSSVTNYLQQVQNNSTIQGYWVLDDWPSYDATAASVLNDIHNLVQQYTPGKPTVCGFGAYITQGQPEWTAALADNFTPTGCDMIAWYIYADTVYTSSAPSASSFDWTMSSLLPRMLSDFKARGWNPSQTPLIGIPQTFGGQTKSDGSYEVVPTDQSVTTQAKALCQAGASSVVYYGWNLSDYNNPQSPLNNSGMSAGVRDGAAACQQIWGTSTSGASPTPTQQPTQLAATATPTATQPAPTATQPVATATSTPTRTVATPVPTATRPAPTATPRPTQPAPTPTVTKATPTSTPSAAPPPSMTSSLAVQAANGQMSGGVYVDSYPTASQGTYIQFTAGTAGATTCPRAGFGGVVTQQLNVKTTGWYYVWSRLTAGSSKANSYWLQIDGDCPILVGGSNTIGSNYWVWVNYRSGYPAWRISVPLVAGAHTLRIESRQADVDVDRLIFTRDGQCLPSGAGANCLSG